VRTTDAVRTTLFSLLAQVWVSFLRRKIKDERFVVIDLILAKSSATAQFRPRFAVNVHIT